MTRPATLSRRLADAMQRSPLADLSPTGRAGFTRRNAEIESVDDMTDPDRELLDLSEGSGTLTADAFTFDPTQPRDVIGQWTKDGDEPPANWKVAIGMTKAQWDKLSQDQKVALLVAVMNAKDGGEPKAAGAHAKLEGWIKADGGTGGKGRGGGGGKSGGGGGAKKDDEDEKKAAERRGGDKRPPVDPDVARKKSLENGETVAETRDGKRRMRWSQNDETFIVESQKDGKWAYTKRLSRQDAEVELSKYDAWVRPKRTPGTRGSGGSGPKTSGTRRTANPGVARDRHLDNTVVAESSSGTRRMRWDDGDGRFVVEDKKGARWTASRRLTPAEAEVDLRKSKAWYAPKDESPADADPDRRRRDPKDDLLIAAAEPHTGAMIALLPSEEDAQRLAVDGGEDAEELHVTLHYLGKAADFGDDRSREALVDLVSGHVRGVEALTVDAFAVSLFNPPGTVQADGKERETCVVLTLGGNGLDHVRHAVDAALEDYGGDTPEQHTPWIPHITLVYTDEADVQAFSDRTGTVVLDRVRVAFGEDVYDIPLGDDVDEDESDDAEYVGEDEGEDPEPGVIAFDEDGHPVVPNVLVDWRVFTRETDVNAPGGPGHNLRDYWVRGPGAAKIAWKTPGDFTRCVANLGKYVKDPKGLCAEYHKQATGMWPGDRRNPGMSDTSGALEDTRSDTVVDGAEEVDDVPWHIEKRGEEFCVVKDADDSTAGCHPTRADAVGQLRALYSGESDAAGGTQVVDTPGASGEGEDCPPGHHRMPGGDCMPDVEMVAAETRSPARWDGVLTVEGLESGDGRQFAANALTWDDPPLPLMWQKETSHGGTGDVSVRVGSIERVWREPDPQGRANVTLIKGEGTLDMGNPDGVEVERRMREGHMRGNSVDVDSVRGADVELVFPETVASPVTDEKVGERPAVPPVRQMFPEPEVTIYKKGRIRATTLVEIPAFTEARLQLVDDKTVTAGAVQTGGAVAAHSTETVDGQWDPGAATHRLLPSQTVDTARGAYAHVRVFDNDDTTTQRFVGSLLHHEVDADGNPGAANLTAVASAIRALHDPRSSLTVPTEERQAVHEHLAAHLRDAGREPPPISTPTERALEAVTAATSVIEIADAPPREWFDEPTDVTSGGALTVTSEGRVYGYVAPAGVRHRSFRSKSVYVPLRNVDYGRFMSGETIVADGGRVATGAITMNCGHATTSVDISAEQAAEHYDNTCSLVATARVGENENGVWIAGALLPDVTPEQLRRVMACRLSGDWRAHLDRPGWREFVAALLVPVPGFPMARTTPTVTTSEGQLVASTIPVRFTRVIATSETPAAVPLGDRVAAVTRRVRGLKIEALRSRVTRHHDVSQ